MNTEELGIYRFYTSEVGMTDQEFREFLMEIRKETDKQDDEDIKFKGYTLFTLRKIPLFCPGSGG